MSYHSDLQPAEATATLSELEMPLANLIRDTAHAVVEALGLEQKDVLVEGLATRWQRGTLVMQPADSLIYPPWRASVEISLPAVVAVANMLAMVFLDSQSTNYDSRNDLRFAHHVQHPVQKQGRLVPNRRLAQRSRQADRLRNRTQHSVTCEAEFATPRSCQSVRSVILYQ